MSRMKDFYTTVIEQIADTIEHDTGTLWDYLDVEGDFDRLDTDDHYDIALEAAAYIVENDQDFDRSDVRIILNEIKQMKTHGKCEKCGHDLMPGVNWYTMKPDHICTDCSGSPNFPAPPIIVNVYDSYEAMCTAEDRILAHQEAYTIDF